MFRLSINHGKITFKLLESFLKDSFDIHYVELNRLRTSNEAITQRNLKIWADMADKICFNRT